MDVTPTASQSSVSTEPAAVQTKKRAHEGSARTLVTSSADGRTVEIEMTDAPSQAASRKKPWHGPRSGRAEPKDLHVAWANVGKGLAQHIALLETCFAEDFDVVQVQEPWVMYPTKTQSHPGYDRYAPVDAWTGEDTRPRVMTYIRKGNRKAFHLSVIQRRPIGSRDLLWLDVNGFAMLNCYRQPRLDSVLDYVTALEPPPDCLIGGDFNAKDRTFEPSIQQSRDGGSRLATWSQETGMHFINIPGEATHRDGHVLDLTFSNIPLASTSVRMDLRCGSDHMTLHTIIPGRGSLNPPKPTFVIGERELDLFKNLVSMLIDTLSDPSDLSAQQVDDQIRRFQAGWASAIETAGRSPSGEGSSAPWWTADCQEAWMDWKQARDDPSAEPDERLEEHHRFKAVVRAAKRRFWEGVIDACENTNRLWKVVAWHKAKARLNPPPIQHNGSLVQDPVGKAEALWAAIGERFSADDDLPGDPLEDWNSADLNHSLVWSQDLTMEELEVATIGPKNTAPGIDLTTINLMTKCWDILKDWYFALVRRCLQLSHFPAPWKEAEVSFMPKGAFDALLKNRLLERMRRQGWPLEVLKLVRSFLSGRRVRARLGTAITGFKDVRCGTPQGSPLSPVLYMLYLAELFALDSQLRFGYADDVAMYRVGKDLEESSEALKADIRKVLDWGATNKVVFAPDKYELIHITSSRTPDNPSIDLGSQVITPIPIRYEEDQNNRASPELRIPALRWLGVWIDRKFTFRRHVAEKCASAMKVVKHLRGLSNTVRGISPGAVRKAVIACVFPTALYGAEVWYAGRLKPAANRSQAGKDLVSARIGGHIDDLQKVFNAAARAILPVWRTTPNGLLCREAAIPSAEMALEEIRLRFSVRLRKSDHSHPLASRVDAPVLLRRKTRLQRTAALLPKVERLIHTHRRYPPGSTLDPTGGLSKEAAATEFEAWLGTASQFIRVVKRLVVGRAPCQTFRILWFSTQKL
ncbi:uncharacterized protein CPUR_07042 [Claviceps purpurea 20.1]|uniref:Reverse transcriptase domain-containing protein n=1 Tax=Claviceps purpurea (strain 20.1) TaxID=1111077 RepID=M1WHQ1_CLAP2|nr:uncharacterized protein CPUR_07042 [Claviceps purpurea 20.1]